MDPNLIALTIAGGRLLADPHAQRDREHLSAFRESQLANREPRVGLLGRIRQAIALKPAEADLSCSCTA